MVLETVGLPPDDITIMLAVEWLLDIYTETDAGPPGRGKLVAMDKDAWLRLNCLGLWPTGFQKL